jgi:7,8-dihydro-6-hydroxymethylpterin dimethyltransferase
MESQTEGLVHLTDFHPKGSENSYCSFTANYIIQSDGSLKPLREPEEGCGCHKPENAREGVRRSRAFVAKHWTYQAPKTLSPSNLSLGGWDEVLERARTHHFSISGMAFQDAWNLDLELLQDCCIAIAAPNGDLVPFCAYNLTNTRGQALYRPQP